MKTFLFAGCVFLLSFNLFFAASVQARVPEKEAFSVRALSEPLDNREWLWSMTVITREEIRNCIGDCDLTGILEKAGVQIQRSQRRPQTSGSSDTDSVHVTLRGTSHTQTHLLVDGVRQKDSTISAPFWSFIPIHHIEHIEIVRSPQSSLGAPIAGAIHIFTRKAACSSKALCLSGGVQLSNKPSKGHTAHVSANIQTNQTRVRLGVQGDKSSDSWKTGDFKEKAFTLRLDQMSEDGKWLWEGSVVSYGNSDTGEPQPAIGEGGSDVVSLGTTYYMSDDLLFKSLLGYNKETQTYTRDASTSRSFSVKLVGEYHFELANGNYKLTAGVEGMKERVDSEPKDFYDYNTRDTQAVFASLNGGQGPITYQVTARVDDISGDTNERIFTWSSVTSWHIAQITANDVFLRVGGGTGFRPPSFDEQFHIGGDPDLPVEESRTYEVGLRIEKNKSYFLDIAAFKTELKNPVIVPLNKRLPEGADIYGLEIQGRITIGSWSGWGQIHFIDTDNTEQLRAHNPREYSASLGMDYSFTSRLTCKTEMTNRGEREDDWLSGESVNLLDIGCFYDVDKNTRWGLGVENATDEEYRRAFFTKGAGRTLRLTLEIMDF